MRQQQTFRGFIFILLMLILIATAVRFPYARQADKVTNQDFIKILEDGQAAVLSIWLMSSSLEQNQIASPEEIQEIEFTLEVKDGYTTVDEAKLMIRYGK